MKIIALLLAASAVIDGMYSAFIWQEAETVMHQIVAATIGVGGIMLLVGGAVVFAMARSIEAINNIPHSHALYSAEQVRQTQERQRQAAIAENKRLNEY